MFTNVANDQEKCWTSDPGNRNLSGTLIGAANRLAQLSREYEARSLQNVTYENTLLNIEGWLQAHGDYCQAAPPFTSRENIDAATGGIAWHQCGNGRDDDNDGHVDCDDWDCSNAATCQPEPEPVPHPRDAQCRSYADRAFQLIEENIARGCGLGGNLWNEVSWELHYNWCLSVTGDVSGYNDARRNGLDNNCK